MIGAGVLGTTMLSSMPGSASNDTALLQAQIGSQSITAQHTQSNTLPQVLEQVMETQLQSQTPSDNLLLAVLSLEASTNSSQVEESKERIMNLIIPDSVPPLGALTAVQEKEEGDVQDADAQDGDEDENNERDEACADTGNAAYCVYTVAEGDTLSAIAQELGFTGNGSLSAAEMLAQSNRPDIMSSDHIEPGQNLRIPRERGIVHTVLFSESAGKIAADYGVDLDAIIGSPYNAIGGDGVVGLGQVVFVPDPTQLPVNQEVELTLEDEESEADEEPTETPTEAPTEEPTPTEEPEEEPTPEPATRQPDFIAPLGPLNTPTPAPTATPTPTSTPAAQATATPEAEPTRAPRRSSSSGLFIWPAQGPISSYFGPSHPLGIDIDLFNQEDAPIVASRGGTVVFAGGDPCCSYGYYVIIDHGNGVQTLYAHLSRILVSEGDDVSQGELIGIGGRTGKATGNHLHFEIRVDGNVVDPMRYLP